MLVKLFSVRVLFAKCHEMLTAHSALNAFIIFNLIYFSTEINVNSFLKCVTVTKRLPLRDDIVLNGLRGKI